MNATLIGWFAASLVCDVGGQLCFKLGTDSDDLAEGNTAASLLAPLANGWVIAGVAVYAVEIFVWVRILSLVPLAVAFPIASLNFLAITVASRLWLHEPVSARRWAGAALVTAGVVLLAQSA